MNTSVHGVEKDVHGTRTHGVTVCSDLQNCALLLAVTSCWSSCKSLFASQCSL